MKVIDKTIIDNKAPDNHTVIWIDTSCCDLVPRIWWNGKWKPLCCSCEEKTSTGAFSKAFSNAFDRIF